MSTISIDIRIIEQIINSLRIRDKIQLLHRLEQDTWQAHFQEILHRIDERLKKHHISPKEINKIVEESKQECYASRHSKH